jgi:chromosome segregation protein
MSYNHAYVKNLFLFMHLTQLKLSGFKSFVLPTVIPFNGQLVGIVGPNGCGKSNIIDAVRWVMGESSAKNLRGGTMADVIFNGSSDRKSVGQASVELVFDNRMGRLTGPYASYQEISLKRVVTRDGESSYFLNGSRCRRRDITDIFLGTGASARGYSIIGQDSISRLIEARPEELREFLEEAAGVSKYKERRRETMLRINQTRENLTRVADILQELMQQLQRLERQASAAKKYMVLKEDERLYQAEILALKWRDVTIEQAVIHQELIQVKLMHEGHCSSIISLDKESTMLQETLKTADSLFQKCQATFYQRNTEIARLEEVIAQQEREKQQLTVDLQQLEQALAEAQSCRSQEAELLFCSEQSLEGLNIEYQTIKSVLEEYQQAIDDIEPEKTAWEIEWQSLQRANHQSLGEAEVLERGFKYAEQQLQQTALRIDKIKTELCGHTTEQLDRVIEELESQIFNCKSTYECDQKRYEQLKIDVEMTGQELSENERELREAEDHLRTLMQELAFHEASLQAQFSNVLAAKHVEWENYSRLAEVIDGPLEWLNACELVLGEGLRAIVIDSIDLLWPKLEELKESTALFVTKNSSEHSTSPHPTLAGKLGGVLPSWHESLTEIFAADSLKEARSWWPTLLPHQSIVTADGFWVGRGFVKIAGSKAIDEQGLLERQQTILTLKKALQLQQAFVLDLKASREKCLSHRKEHESQVGLLKQTLSEVEAFQRSLMLGLGEKQRTREFNLHRMSTLTEERSQLENTSEAFSVQMAQTKTALDGTQAFLLEQKQSLDNLSKVKANWEDKFRSLMSLAEEAKAAMHQIMLLKNKETLKAEQNVSNIDREDQRIERIGQQMAALNARLVAILEPLPCSSLDELVRLQQQEEQSLFNQQQELELLRTRLKDIIRNLKAEEQASRETQATLTELQLKEQTQLVRASGLQDTLASLNQEVDHLLLNISLEVTLATREQDLERVRDKIARMGAINLVAIEEYQIELLRKQHLDEQYSDLLEALETLDTAIAKMDKETHLRLKETFDEVNAKFQVLFPRLFGGGRARLELSCDNLLEAGVLVMAQPPGKRNSTIHLLSGGEKAMTAVALVFAIFQLNPSPFCMLDEVDAPLDDLNVRRFCDLVKEMSLYVQFLFVTHNKVTMELADHLIGVTMREPGVSRIVAVDVEEALSIAE